MSQLLKVIKYQLHDIIRGRWLVMYAGMFFLLTLALFRFGTDPGRVALSLMNLILLLIPLVSIVYGTMYYYNSREFLELLLAQPFRRNTLFLGLYLGFCGALTFAFVLGVGLPALFYGVIRSSSMAILLLVGVLLTASFCALAFLVAVVNTQRVRGIGLALVVWLLLAVLYDGGVLLILYAFQDYPLEIPGVVLAMLNPIDLGRILLLLQFDISALMGYTGAVFQRFFGSSLGLSVATLTLLIWILVPFLLGRRYFGKKDF